MQVDNRFHNPDYTDQYLSLTIKQPFAQELVTECREDEEGNTYAIKTIEVRSQRTSYRGDVLICASKNPQIIGYQSGVTLGLVELYDCKPVSEFTSDDWDNTRIPRDKREQIKDGYGWMFRNPRKVVEMPTRGKVGLRKLTTPKGEIIEYPQLVTLDV